MLLFYTPSIRVDDTFLQLSEEESKHAIRVLRLQSGDTIQLTDGRGTLFQATIEDGHPKRTLLRITERQHAHAKPDHYLHMAIAPTKNMDRLEWFVEKATELGIQEITPIICTRSERKDLKRERVEKVAIAAMKQSLKAYLPLVNTPQTFVSFIDQTKSTSAKKAIAHCVEGDKQFINAVFSPSQSYIVLIGPEGDFSPEEIALAQGSGYQAISLGASRLRTETAALLACAEVNLLNR